MLTPHAIGVVTLAILITLVLAPAAVEAQTGPQASPCCTVTAVDPSTGIVKAHDAQGHVFAFKVRDAWRLKGLAVGQKIYADFTKKVVAIQADDFCCDIVEVVQSPVRVIIPGLPGRNAACGGEPVQQRALSDTCAHQYNAMMDEYKLKERLDQIQILVANLDSDRGYYRGAIVQCAVWDAAMVMLEYATGKISETPPTGLSKEQAEYLVEYQKSVEKIRSAVPQIIERDPRVVVPEKFDNAFKLFDNASSLFKAAHITPEKAAARLDDCYGKINDDLYKRGKRYISNLQEMVRQASTLAVYRNNLRAKAQECWDRQAAYYRVCVDWAHCSASEPQRVCKAPGS